MRTLPEPIEFEWDKGNELKIQKTHAVGLPEAEDVFFDDHKKTFPDVLHSGSEERLRIIGKTKQGRLLFVVFTIRKEKVRVISARDVNKKEVPLYEKTT